MSLALSAPLIWIQISSFSFSSACIIEKPPYAHLTTVLTMSHCPHILASTPHKIPKYMTYPDLFTIGTMEEKLIVTQVGEFLFVSKIPHKSIAKT
jgi:hypothetical protein